jgi:hypothetical protein
MVEGQTWHWWVRRVITNQTKKKEGKPRRMWRREEEGRKKPHPGLLPRNSHNKWKVSLTNEEETCSLLERRESFYLKKRETRF